LGSNALQQQVYGNFMPIADTANFLIVHPEGSLQFGAQFWNVGALSSPNDVDFVKDLLDSLKKIYTIDENAVYTTGLSNGGIMSYYLACNAPGVFAAVASVAGTNLRTWFNSCSPALPIPAMEIHGTNDATVPYDGANTAVYGSFVPIDSVMLKWRAINQCNAQPQITNLPDASSSDGCVAVHYKWAQGLDNSSVELYKIIGGGHTWPGAPPFFPETNQDFSASVEIWRFFRQYSRNQFVTAVGLQAYANAEPLQVYPNPASSAITLTVQQDAEVAVIDFTGKQVATFINGLNSVEQLSPGIYILREEHSGKSTKFIKQ
jgi:polyhydroxybutyrate depolymerase